MTRADCPFFEPARRTDGTPNLEFAGECVLGWRKTFEAPCKGGVWPAAVVVMPGDDHECPEIVAP